MKLMNVLFYCFIFLVFLSTNTMASVAEKTKILNLNIVAKNDRENQLVIELGDKFLGNPEVLIKDKILQVSVPDSFVWPKIDKTISANTIINETKISAYQFDPKTVRVRALLPYSLHNKEDEVTMKLVKNKIIVDFPKTVIAQKIVKNESKQKENIARYDESYLERLLKDKEEKLVDNSLIQGKVKDIVKTSQSSSLAQNEKNKTSSNSFSVTNYIGKFVGFLAIVLLLFYGLVNLMKKGVFKKSRLGFLNSEKLVEVLNTTYIAPKKSILLIKAHNQIFLVGNSEKGFDALGEIKDVASLIKTGEEQIMGSNFDLSLDKEAKNSSEEKTFKLKEDITKSIPIEEPKTKIVKVTEEIKKKVKNLKQLQ